MLGKLNLGRWVIYMIENVSLIASLKTVGVEIIFGVIFSLGLQTASVANDLSGMLKYYIL